MSKMGTPPSLEFRKHGVKHIVRACEPTYDASNLKKENIIVYDMPFEDGGAPPAEVIDAWLDLLMDVYSGDAEAETIGVHCVAGLGRAPVLVAIALVEEGMPYLDAVTLIRKKRKGAINSKQLEFLKNYKKRGKKAKNCVVQ